MPLIFGYLLNSKKIIFFLKNRLNISILILFFYLAIKKLRNLVFFIVLKTSAPINLTDTNLLV